MSVTWIPNLITLNPLNVTLGIVCLVVIILGVSVFLYWLDKRY